MSHHIDSSLSARVADGGPASVVRESRPIALWQVLALGATIFLLYAPVLLKLVTDWWRNPNYSHAFAIPIFAVYVAVKKREAITSLSPLPSWAGLVLVVGCIGVLFVGSLGAELFLARVSLVGVLIGLIAFLHGWRMVRVLAFPLATLLLMIPLPTIIYNEIVFPLQLLASKIAAGCLEQTQIIPVLREGNVLILPNARLEVVEACSGIRSLVSLVTLAAIYGYFAERRRWVRIVLVLLMLPVAVLANSVRVLFTALSSQIWGAAAIEGWRHELSGLMLFLFATGVLLLVHALITRIVVSREQEPAA